MRHQKLDIPNWAKFMRDDNSAVILLLMALGITGLLSSSKGGSDID